MGADFPDYDNDGRPDIVLRTATEILSLYRNDGNGTFSYGAFERPGCAVQRKLGLGTWAGSDFDNDGWKDLFVARSHVLDNVERIDPGVHYSGRRSWRRIVGGKFGKCRWRERIPARGAGWRSGT